MHRFLIAGLLGLACLAPAADQGTAPGMDADERRIGLAELPAPAREAIQREAGESPIGDVTRLTTDGRVVYQVTIGRDGIDRRVQVAADGTVLREHDRGGEVAREGAEAWEKTKDASHEAWQATKETSKEAWATTKDVAGNAWERGRSALDDDGLTLANVPSAVKAGIEREAAGQEVVDIDVDASAGAVFYAAELRVPEARNRIVKIDLQGNRVPDADPAR